MTDAFANRPVVVVGGLGFVGSNLVRRLIELGARVTVVDNLLPGHGGNPRNLDDIVGQLTVRIADIRDATVADHAVAGHQIVFNLAAHTSHMGSLEDPLLDLDVNARGALVMLEACRRREQAPRVVFASTRQVYGPPDYRPVDEKHPIRPPDPDGVSKHAAEQYHALYGRVHGLACTVLRLTNTYGPRMRIADARQCFVGLWVRRLLEGEPIEVWGGTQRRDLAFVDDVVEAMLLSACRKEAVGRTFNVGGAGGEVSLLELARMLIEANGGGEYRVRDFPEDRKRIDIGDFWAEDRAIREALGWRPRIELREGLKRTLDYYRANLAHYL